jgi:hypothetical protein
MLTVSHQIGLGRVSVKNMTVYATMQPGSQLAAPSMGVEVVVGSASGAFEAMVKSEAKESIGVYICERRDAMNLSEA